MMSELSAEAVMQAAADAGWQGEVAWLPAVTSTNDLAARLAAGSSRDALIVADYQTAGRGRRGRPWHAPAGTSLLMSLLLRIRQSSHPVQTTGHVQTPYLQHYTMMAALAAARACETVTGLRVRTKWPNDIVFAPEPGGRLLKVGGVLAEVAAAAAVGRGWSPRPTDRAGHAPTTTTTLRAGTSALPQRGRASKPSVQPDGSTEHAGVALVLGTGINANQSERDLPPDVRGSTSSLALLCGRRVQRMSILAAYIRDFGELRTTYEAEGPDGLLRLWRSMDQVLGRRVIVRTGEPERERAAPVPVGRGWKRDRLSSQLTHGVAVRVRNDGALVVARDACGLKRQEAFTAGDVTVVVEGSASTRGDGAPAPCEQTGAPHDSRR